MRGELHLDIETFSSVDIKKTNPYAYAESPDFEVLMCGWSLDGSPVEVVDGEEAIAEIPGLWSPGVTKVAHNAGFERVCLSVLRGLPVGTYLPPGEWEDTAALAASAGLPRSLDGAAKALGATPKDSAGTRLINLFCVPNKQGRRTMPRDAPEKWEEFRRYCGQDVSTLIEVHRLLPGWQSALERALWCADQRVNDRGITVDIAMAARAVQVAEANDAEARREVIDLTGVANPGSTKQLGEWTASRGVPMPDWQAETVKMRLQDGGLPDDVERVLHLRQELALVASNKYSAALRGVSRDGRLRGQFVFHGAHTGRWSSKGVQLHNLAKKGFTDKDGETSLPGQGLALLDLMNGFGASPQDLKKLVRPLFTGPFVISDYSAIEARVLAWLSGEAWVLRAFEEGRDLYVETAARMGGGMGRPEGKIAVLAAGYQGSVGSFRNMGYGGRRCPLDLPRRRRAKTTRARPLSVTAAAVLAGQDGHSQAAVDAFLEKAARVNLPDDEVAAALAGHLAEKRRDPNHKCDVEVKAIVDAWRAANSHIRDFWYNMEAMFWEGGRVGKILVRVSRDRRIVHLPSGRRLTYYGVRRVKERREDEETGEVRLRNAVGYRHTSGFTEKTYGGKLVENVTQAVARDLLADAIVRLDAAGYAIVAHVHDEVVVESDDVAGIKALMETGPGWAKGLPLAASAAVSERYTK